MSHGGYPDYDPSEPYELNKLLTRTERESIVGAAVAAHEARWEYASRLRSRAGYPKCDDTTMISYDDYGWGLEGAR